MTPRSWVNECIPNILWAAILASALQRLEYLRLFRSVAINTREHVDGYEGTFITHNHMKRLSNRDFDTIFKGVFENDEALEALSALLLVDCLPDKDHWERRLSAPDENHWQILATAVANCFDHQSQKATDIRWLKLMHLAIVGRLHFASTQAELVEQLRLYPDQGDMRSVRPAIRAMEIGLRTFEFGEEGKFELPPLHSDSFWREVHSRTQCMPDEQQRPHDIPKEMARQLLDIAQDLANHFHATIETTGIDARHDSCFGLALYAIQMLTQACIMYNHSSAGGRAILRTIVECFITLLFLVTKDDQTLWLKHRDYGSGQAKLSFLKNLRSDTVPKFIDLDRLEALANEDRWLEFSDIQLGSWSELSLRMMAEEAGVKDV